MDRECAVCESAEFVGVGPHTPTIPFVLSYYQDTIVFARDTKSVLVYDEDEGTWKGSSDGNRLLLAKVEELNATHKAYCMSRNKYICPPMCRTLSANTPFDVVSGCGTSGFTTLGIASIPRIPPFM